MLSQIVRPMVRTQLRLLANSQATRSTLITTVSQWLGFLGVQAKVTELGTTSNQIQLSLTVGKPESCDGQDWEKILSNLEEAKSLPDTSHAIALTSPQERKLQRLMAYMIQVGDPDHGVNWEELDPQLRSLGFDESMLLGIKSAAKVPQSLELLTEELDVDVAAIALSKAVGIALLDRQVNPGEDQALSAFLKAMKH